MEWFKHYCRASDDEKIAALEDKFGDFGYAAYFKILEICCEKLKDNEEKFVLNPKRVRQKLNCYQNKVELLLNFAATLNLLSFNKTQLGYEIKVPNLLKLMNKDHKYNKGKRKQVSSPTTLEENRIEENRIEESISSLPPRTVFDLWNEMARQVDLQQVRSLTAARQKKIKAAIRAVPELDDWKKILTQVPQDKFRRGINDRGWAANFDWLFRNENYLLMLEESEHGDKERDLIEGDFK
jgi:hypothetical protein